MHLGDVSIQKNVFASVDAVIKDLKKLSSKIDRNRTDAVSVALYELIQKEEEPCFLLSSVLDFIEKVDKEEIVQRYTFASFELWLNQVSGITPEENLRIRGKIVGKWIDRSDYQAFFPIGMGKIFEGSHFVTAHKSPDLDTTIASFWGWVDAFGARVASALHLWNLPGGPPASQIEIKWVFEDLFGKGVFTHLPKTRTTLNLTSKDLMTRSGMVVKKLTDSVATIDHERDARAVIVTDDEGYYLGDWRSFDVEQVRHVAILMNSCLRWFENHLHLQLITLFAKEKLSFDEVQKDISKMFSIPFEDSDPVKELYPKQKQEASQFLSQVLGINRGFSATFEEIGQGLSRLVSIPFEGSSQLLDAIKGLFDKSGSLIEDRPKIFSFLEVVVRELRGALLKIRERLEKLDIAMKIKTDVFDNHPTFVTTGSDVTEILEKIGSRVALTVAHPDGDKLFPLGVIQAKDLRKPILGTVSLRDFCNREEIGIPAYLDVISVIDHHKSQLQTTAPPFAIIADAQSSNTLVARQAFEINDLYSLGGQTLQGIEAQIKGLSSDFSPSASRLLQRLLKKRNLAERNTSFFVHPDREYTEYLHFVYGILDDTDLLSKVSVLDVECVVSLLNRMKSISAKKEMEVMSLESIPRDKNFAGKAAQRILQNEEMYSLYSKVYEHRAKEMGEHIRTASKDKDSFFFADTKEQSGCCRVGQTKLFAQNIPLFTKRATDIQKVWVESAAERHEDNPEIDLHIHMTSTIVSAEEVYKGVVSSYSHQDEMWIWIPKRDVAIEHLKGFLTSFQQSPGMENNAFELELVGPDAAKYQPYFKESFSKLPIKLAKSKISLMILRYNAGSLNSRKAMISPFLPKL